MGNASAFTQAVQERINSSIIREIAEINEQMEDMHSFETVLSFLKDTTMLSTPDFVLRRHIQNNHPELLTNNEGKAFDFNDSRFRNVPWDKDGSTVIVGQVAQKLAARCARLNQEDQRNPRISKTIWMNYLAGTGTRPQRFRVFQIAMILQMDLDTAKKYCLACNQDPYNMRNPLELIAYYCQHWPSVYRWSDVQALMEQYLERIVAYKKVPAVACPSFAPIAGRTAAIGSKLERLLAAEKSDQELLDYMVENADQLAPCWKTAKGKIKVDTPLSMTNRLYYMRFLQYLVVLYPTVHKMKLARRDASEIKQQYGKGGLHIKKDLFYTYKTAVIYSQKFENDEAGVSIDMKRELSSAAYDAKVPVRMGENGVPDFPDLLYAMYQRMDWEFDEWAMESGGLGEADEEPDGVENDYIFLAQYYNRGMGILRDPSKSKTCNIVGRRDVLLLGYFFLYGFRECSLEQANRLKAFAAGEAVFQPEGGMSQAELMELLRPFDQIMANVMEEMENDDIEIRDATQLGLSRMLRCFGFVPLYVPAAFDRFVWLSLLTEDGDTTLPRLLLHKEENCE